MALVEHSYTFTFLFFRNVLILNSREVIEDALVSHSSAFSGRSPLYTESIVNPNSKGGHYLRHCPRRVCRGIHPTKANDAYPPICIFPHFRTCFRVQSL